MRPPADDGWGAVLAWYSLVHLAASELPAAIAALVRPLRPGGTCSSACTRATGCGTSTRGSTSEVALDFVLHDPAEVAAARGGGRAGRRRVVPTRPAHVRDETTERLYVLGRRPS